MVTRTDHRKQQQNTQLETERIMIDQHQYLVDALKKVWKPDDERCGHLVQRHEVVWHYSVALSNDMAVAWGGAPHHTGSMRMHAIDPRFTDTINVTYLPIADIYLNLLGSVLAFHENWNYGVGWNCEHWARLVSTGQPKSYQVSQCLLGILDMLGFGWRGEAIAYLASHTDQLRAA
jgi:hypothetical protein